MAQIHVKMCKGAIPLNNFQPNNIGIFYENDIYLLLRELVHGCAINQRG